MSIDKQLFDSNIDWSKNNIYLDIKSNQVKTNPKKLNKYDASIAIQSIKNFVEDMSNIKELKKDDGQRLIQNLTHLKDVINERDKGTIEKCIGLMEDFYSQQKIPEKPPFLTREDVFKSLPEEIPFEIMEKAKEKADAIMAKDGKMIEQYGLEYEIEKIAAFVLMFKEAAKKLAPDQHAIHFGQNFAEKYEQVPAAYKEMPVSIEVYRKPDGTLETLLKIKHLKSGGYKTVSLGYIFETGELIARAKSRFVHKEARGDAMAVAKKEAYFLTLLKDVPHIIQTHNITFCSTPLANKETKTHQILLLEFCNKGDLNNVLDDLPAPLKGKIALDVLECVIEMHKLGVIHRDLKLENILVKEDPNPSKEDPSKSIHIVVTDFGLAIEKKDNAILQTQTAGTRQYQAPEVWLRRDETRGIPITDPILNKLKNQPISSKIDDWSVGCLLWELFTETILPWKEEVWDEDPQKVIEGFKMLSNRKTLPEPPDPNSPAHIAWRMLDPDPDKRMSIEDALKALQLIFPPKK